MSLQDRRQHLYMSSSHIDEHLCGGEIIASSERWSHAGGPFRHHVVKTNGMLGVLLIVVKQREPQDMLVSWLACFGAVQQVPQAC
jgi:hypothetical protein